MLPRKDYPIVINTELQQLDFEIAKLQRRLERSSDQTKHEYLELIEMMRSKLRKARAKLKALEKATDENWDEVKLDLDHTRDALKSMLSSTVAQVV